MTTSARTIARARPATTSTSRRPSSTSRRSATALNGERPPWGVGLERIGRAIVVTPRGSLDAVVPDRRRELLDSRHGDYESVVVDLRDAEGLGEAGLRLLLDQQDWARRAGVGLAVIAGPEARAGLARLDVDGELVVVDELD